MFSKTRMEFASDKEYLQGVSKVRARHFFWIFIQGNEQHLTVVNRIEHCYSPSSLFSRFQNAHSCLKVVAFSCCKTLISYELFNHCASCLFRTTDAQRHWMLLNELKIVGWIEVLGIARTFVTPCTECEHSCKYSLSGANSNLIFENMYTHRIRQV